MGTHNYNFNEQFEFTGRLNFKHCSDRYWYRKYSLRFL